MAINDFGFSFIDDTRDELERVTNEKEVTIGDLQNRLQLMYDAIDPLLNNLASNPEKTTIYWPNREEVIKQFRSELEALLRIE